MGRSKKKSRDVSTSQQLKQSNNYEGDQLISLLNSIHKELESAKLFKGSLPEKIWIKQQFSIGVNDVTRVLERMPPTVSCGNSGQDSDVKSLGLRNSSVQLQAVILASDCNPRWLTKHIPSLASSRKVPIITVKDKKGGSLRLGQLVKLKTAIAIGVKANGSGINKLVAEILDKMENAGDTESCQVG
ncbi:hypothetical protein ACHQM5_025865 [Ranunculus cassubicifolius]